MTAWERRSFNALVLLVTVSGLGYLWMKYFMQSPDPFSVINHPLQPLMLQLHILASPMLILVMGIIFQSHIARKVRGGHRPNRRSGLTALVTFAVMTLSGYLLQVASHPVFWRAALVVHLSSGAIFAASYVIHLIVSVGLVNAATRKPTPEVSAPGLA